MSDKLWYLNQLNLFKGIDKTRLSEIEEMFSMRNYCKGDSLYHPDRDYVYIVKSGRVELYTVTPDGQKYILDILSKGSVFGNLNPDQDPSYAEVLEDSYVCYMERDKFFAIISEEPEVSQKFMSHMFEKLSQAEKKAASFATDNALHRLVKLIINLGHESVNEKMITEKHTHEQLAHMLGISRQTVTTLVNNLEREGKIQRFNKRLMFTRPTLEELVN